MHQHQLFRQLLTNKIYIDVNRISEKLSSFVFKNHQKNLLILFGESGIGKSTILAHFDENQREAGTDNILIVSRYIGITIESNSTISLLKSIVHELLERHAELKQQISSDQQDYDENDLHDVMAHLYKVMEQILVIYAHKWILLMFESVHELQPKQLEELQFLNLILSSHSHPNIKIILSTSSRSVIRRVEDTNKENVLSISVDAMKRDEILMFIKQYLSQYGKVFDDKQKAVILEHEQTVSNPLFLSIFLEEVRCFGSFENLNDYIQSYITVASISELFEKVMIRLEGEFAQHNDILKHTLCLLYVSRNGLLPTELELCLEYVMGVSKIEKTFPIFEYASLMHQLINLHFIREVAGKYMMIHRFISDAVQSKYFVKSDDEVRYLKAIHKGFMLIYRDERRFNQRFIDQVPHSLHRLIQDFDATEHEEPLLGVIGHVECIQYMRLPHNTYDFHKYWDAVKSDTNSIDACFKQKLKELVEDQYTKDQVADFHRDLAIFMIDTGRYNCDIEHFLTGSIMLYDSESLQVESVRFELAKLHQKRNEFEKSLGEYNNCVKLLTECVDHDKKENELHDNDLKLRLLIRRSGLAGIQRELGQFSEAAQLYEHCLRDKTELLGDNSPLVAIDMINVASIYINMIAAKGSNHSEDVRQDYLKKAEDLAFSAEKIFENNFGPDCLQLSMVYSLLASVAECRNEYSESIKYLEHAKAIKVDKLGANNIDLLQCLSNLGNCYLNTNSMANALQNFNDAYNLISKYTQHSKYDKANAAKLLLCHNNLANYYLLSKQFDLALNHLIECRDMIEEAWGAKHSKLIDPLLSLADVYNGTIKDYEAAERIYERVLNIADEHKSENFTEVKMQCFGGLADLHFKHYSNYNKSITYLDKQLELLQDNPLQKVDILHSKVAVYAQQSSYVNAWTELQSVLKIFHKSDKDGNRSEKHTRLLATTYSLCGNVMFELNRQNDCIEFYEKQLKLMDQFPVESTKEAETHETAQSLLLLAILHFGNQNLAQSKQYFHRYLEADPQCNRAEINEWLSDLSEAEKLLS